MAVAIKDNNGVPTLLGTLNTDGKTPINLVARASDHSMMITDGTTGSNNGNGNRDNNMVPVAFAVSSSDGITPVALYVDSSGNLLVKST